MPAPSSSLSEQRCLDASHIAQRIGTALISSSLCFLEINEALAAMNGVPIAETVGQPVEHVLPELAPVLVPILHHVLATGEPVIDVEIVGQVPASPQDRRWRASYLPVRSRGGSVLAIDVSVQDLGVAKHGAQRGAINTVQTPSEAEQALARLDALLDGAPIGIGFWDTELRYIRLNELLAEINGLPVETHVGRTVREMVPDLAEQSEQLLRTVLETRESVLGVEIEGETPAAPGVRRKWRVSHYPVSDRNGMLLGVGAVVEDVTEQKRDATALALLANISEVLSESLDVTTTLDRIARLMLPTVADYCIVDLVTKQGIERVAWAHADSEKERILAYIQQHYPPRAENPVSRVLQSGMPFHQPEIIEQTLLQTAVDQAHLDMLRELHPRSAIVVPMQTRSKVLGTISFVVSESSRRYDERDVMLAQLIARRAALAIDNAQLYAQSQATVREREAFLSIASHEMKNPLTTMLGYTEMLQRRFSPAWSEREQRAVGVIHDQARRLNGLMNDLLDLSRIETGQLVIEQRPVDLVALAQSLAEELAPTLANHSLDLDLPPHPVVVAGDLARLEQVLQNLLNNAVKYSPNGGTIVVRVGQRGEDVCVDVVDQGIGIPQNAQPHIFDRFYRVPNTESKASGSGIGLYVVKEIIAHHNGKITVTSKEGRGSTFAICLNALQQ